MSDNDYFDPNEIDPEEFLRESGLLGQEFIVHCNEEPDDFLTLRRIGNNKVEEVYEAVISLVTHVDEASAGENKITGGVMLTPHTARITAAALMNAADEIEGFNTMFKIVNGDADE